jgi:hypothetical protein
VVRITQRWPRLGLPPRSVPVDAIGRDQRERPSRLARIITAALANAKSIYTPIRIVVSDSGDLAYEYAMGVVTTTMKDDFARARQGRNYTDLSRFQKWMANRPIEYPTQ